jgi:aspartyl-tRNA(Asn)/glutamyl-tRNA(Gln) amidotransferase subunit A
MKSAYRSWPLLWTRLLGSYDPLQDWKYKFIISEIQLKSGRHVGPMHGIPVSIKDVLETEGIRTTCCSKLMQDHVSKVDSTAVRRLKMAGAFVLGKLTTHEFALGTVCPPTRNPWNLECIPGGSSGGSAAAVAVSSAIATLGSDTLGSIRIPSSFCGVVGLKPTYSKGRSSARTNIHELCFL